MKKLPVSAKIASYWLAALGLHGILLMLPLPSAEPPIKEQPVKVVQLPKQKPEQLRIAQAKSPTAKAKPVQKKAQVMPQIAVERRSPDLVVKQPPAEPTPPKPESSQKQESPANQSPAPTAPQPSQSSDATETPNKTLTSFAQSEAGSQSCDPGKETCWIMRDSHLRSVAEALPQRLTKSGYQVQEKEDLEEAGMKVFQVSKNGKSEFYLHLLSTNGGGTAYLRADRILTREELEAKVQG